MDRRDLLTGNYTKNRLDLSKSIDSTYAYAKLVGTADKAMVHYSLEGTIFAYLPGGPIPFIGFQAILKGVWEKLEQDSFRYTLFESGFFHSLDSKNHIEIFQNPITKKENQLSYIKGGPYESIIKPNQLDWVVSGDDIWIQEPKTRKGYFGNSESGEQKKQTSFANVIFKGKLSELNDSTTIASSIMTYNYLSPWYPFFDMDDVDGNMYWQAVGNKIQSWSDVPETMKNFLNQQSDNYFESTNPWSETTSTLKNFRKNSK
ncbi:MAG: DUF1838 family protein [Gammaproteobacteria bacterium]|nr:DUF1838 family protein [Gammaproteobacteria bacterium]